MYPRSRLNALTDGLFGVAMTLLVLDIRLPDDFRVGADRDLIAALSSAWPKFLPYAISWFVLGSRWLSSVQLSEAAAPTVDAHYAVWWLAFLLFITVEPITTNIVARFPHRAPAICLYAGNTALIAATSWRMMAFVPESEWTEPLRLRRLAVGSLLVTSVLTIVISLFSTEAALWAMVATALTTIPLRLVWMPKKMRAPAT
jgi:uncharacterized membrane protein